MRPRLKTRPQSLAAHGWPGNPGEKSNVAPCKLITLTSDEIDAVKYLNPGNFGPAPEYKAVLKRVNITEMKRDLNSLFFYPFGWRFWHVNDQFLIEYKRIIQQYREKDV